MINAAQKAHIRPIHPFPARMAPSIVWDSLPPSGKPLRILDPMAGSGTSLVCVREKGHFALGCDTDPLALLISRTWCADTDASAIRKRAILVKERAVLLACDLDAKTAYPSHADEETKEFIQFWFDDINRIQLTALATCISRVRSDVERLVLWCALSRLIITKSSGASLAMDVSHSRPHKVYEVAPILALEKFLKAVNDVLKNSPFQTGQRGMHKPAADIRCGDARRLPIKSDSIDMIITSPPYLNAIDYLRGHKLSLVWMGHGIAEIRKLRSGNIGSEVSVSHEIDNVVKNALNAMCDSSDLDNRQLGMFSRYANDMNDVLKECARVLKSNGDAIFVVGDSSLKGMFIKNSEAITVLAKHHELRLTSRVVRPIPENRRYLPPPTIKTSGKELQRRMREEIILSFIRE